MKYLLFIIFILAVIFVFYILHLFVRATKYDIQERFMHIRMIIAIALASIISTNVLSMPQIISLLDKLINNDVMNKVWETILPLRSFALIYEMLLAIFLNLAITSFLIIVLSVIKLIFRKPKFINPEDYDGLSKIYHFPWVIASFFYKTDDDENWRLTERGIIAGIWAKAMKKVFLIIAIIELLFVGVCLFWGSKEINSILQQGVKGLYMLPMAAYLFVEQIQYFFEADLDEEAGSFSSAEIGERNVGNLHRLAECYLSIFTNSKALIGLFDYYKTKNSSSKMYSNNVSNSQVNDCKQPEILKVLAKQLNECAVEQNESYQNALVALLNGDSVNIRDQVEGEFLIYVATYLNFYMSQGKTALFLCKDRESADKLCDILRSRMEDLNNICSIWNICNVEQAEKDIAMNILICSYSDFLNYRIIEHRYDFINDLFCVIIADAFHLISSDEIRLHSLFNRLKNIRTLCQYIIITQEDNDGVRTAFEKHIGRELVPFHNDIAPKDTDIIIWKKESAYRIQNVVGIKSTNYLGVALPLSLVALKKDFSCVYIPSQTNDGRKTFSDIAKMSLTVINDYLGDSRNLEASIRYDAVEAMSPHDLSVMVVCDAHFNFFNTIREWSKYGGRDGALLHVISPPYMLREFFTDNFDMFCGQNSNFDALVPRCSSLKHSCMSALLMDMCYQGISEGEIFARVNEFGWNYSSITDLLQDCLKSTVLKDEEFHNIYECFRFSDEPVFVDSSKGFEYHTIVSLGDENIRKRLINQMSCAMIVIDNDRRFSLPIIGENIANYYLNDQIIPFGDYYYRVNSVSNSEVYVSQDNSFMYLPDYYTISDFEFKNSEKTDGCMDWHIIDFNIYCADVRRNIYGYWSSIRGCEFADENSVNLNNLIGKYQEGKPQSIDHKKCNILEIRISNEIIIDRRSEFENALVVILNELFKTLFPGNYQNIFAMTSSRPKDNFWYDIFHSDTVVLSDKIRSIIPFVSVGNFDEDKVPSNTAVIYVTEFSCCEFGLVNILYENRAKVFHMIKDYLKWYLSDSLVVDNDDTDEIANDEDNAAKSQTRGSFLHFGDDSIPDILDLKLVLAICEMVSLETDNEAPVSEVNDDLDKSQVCTFCGRESLFATELEDGRRMCTRCKDNQIDRREEIKDLYSETVRALTDRYGIQIRENIHVRFQSAEAIRKVAPVVDGRVLGFYQHSNHQLWIEGRGPRVSVRGTLIHELTHSWQNDTLNLRLLSKKLPVIQRKEIEFLLLEGHAVYVEITVMQLLNETEYAKSMDRYMHCRNDEYGRGYRMMLPYMNDCAAEGSFMDPFYSMEKLVSELINGTKKVEITTDGEARIV